MVWASWSAVNYGPLVPRPDLSHPLDTVFNIPLRSEPRSWTATPCYVWLADSGEWVDTHAFSSLVDTGRARVIDEDFSLNSKCITALRALHKMIGMYSIIID